MAATLPLPALARLLSAFMAEKLLVNDFVVSFGVLEAEADETVSPVRPLPPAVRLASLPDPAEFLDAYCPPLLSFERRGLRRPTYATASPLRNSMLTSSSCAFNSLSIV